jgi:Cu(I)/Ag(I) efflux system membrane fusion protein
MHPEIIRNEPGSCPICGMDLVKKESESKTIEDVDLEVLLQPTNSFVVSSVPVITIEQREEDITLNVVGTVAYDTRQAGSISSRVKGRIEKLYVRYKYQPIIRGQKIMDIYSPDLVTAQQNFLFLLTNDPGNTSLVSAAKERLRLMSMSSNQIEELIRTRRAKYSVAVFSNYSGFVTDFNSSPTNMQTDNMQSPQAPNQGLSIKEGMYVESGQAIFSIYNPSKAWILLDVFPDQQTLIKVGNTVKIIPETAPYHSINAKINYIEPVFRQGTKTLNARVYFNNASLQLPIGSRVTATVFASSKNANWVSKTSLLSLGRDRIVFVKTPGGFKAHKIITGLELNQHVQVISGLAASDSIAQNAQFLVDNEAFIKVSNK